MQSSREAMLVSQSKALLIWLGKNQPNEIIYLKTLSKVVRCFFFFFFFINAWLSKCITQWIIRWLLESGFLGFNSDSRVELGI